MQINSCNSSNFLNVTCDLKSKLLETKLFETCKKVYYFCYGFFYGFFYAFLTTPLSIFIPKLHFINYFYSDKINADYIAKIDEKIKIRKEFLSEARKTLVKYDIYSSWSFDKIFHKEKFKNNCLEYKKKIDKLCDDYVSLSFNFPFTSKKQFYEFYNLLKPIAKKFHLDETQINYYINNKGIAGVALEGIPKFSNSIINLDPFCFKTTEEAKGVIAHEMAHLSKHHKYIFFPLIILLFVSRIFLLSYY